PRAREPAPPLDPPRGRTVHLYPAEKLQGWIVLGHALPPVPPEERAALEVMNYILGGGHFDTRLFRETRDERGLTNDDSGYLEPYVRGPGTYTFRTYGRPGAVKLLLEITMREIERIRSEPVTEEELFVARGALADGSFADRWAGGTGVARSLALEAFERGGHRASATYRERVRAVTATDVRAAARKYLHPERMTVVIVGPLDEIRAAPPLESERELEAWGEVVEHGPAPGGP
ncbi:MAG: insulinase family protein, partial [Gemmatimonadetes bacterium]|nr:insulinase family protein [Gemmatimonadota bacterium]NIR79258.1 insulinase family protein [Gemmatimonadota bacterium]NIT87921.1 insulinase family protein [Gemmatimonadota bacterium]NIU31778.1 insulinase family protein [Gemmatimonadota bacterium]NIU36388.1 insulinase family protein [Gemmatimonadota bacterium]